MRLRFWLILSGFLLTVTVMAAVIWLTSADARRQIEKMAVANSDSTQWALAQSEVEFLVMLEAMADAGLAPPVDRPAALRELRQRFDIFYSRILILDRGQVFERLRQNSPVAMELARTRGYLDDLVPLIDGPDEPLLAALPRIRAAGKALRPALRAISLEGVRDFSRDSDRQREQVAAGLRDLAVLVGLLFGGLVGLVVALAVLTRRARAQALRITQTHDRLRAVVATSQDAIVVADRHGRIGEFNLMAEQVFGHAADTAIGTDLATLILPPDGGDAARLLSAPPDAPLPRGPVQTLARRRSGEVFPVELSVARVSSEEGPLVVAFLRDISQRVAAEAELIAARDRALAGERAKADMLAVMSHEMRTPLNGLLGTLDLLMTTALNHRQRRYVRVMERSGQLLLTHVNTVLDIASADARVMRLKDRPFDPHALAAQVLDGLRAQAQQRGNQLSLEMLGDNRRALIGDPVRLTQILVNLVGNAIKFTEGGRITVRIDRPQGSGLVEFRVMDTGIGIDPRDHDRIFDEFVTLDPSFRREVEGTGLGLGIVRRLTALMGGEVRVESAPGQGSCFTVSLPLADQTSPSDAAPPILHHAVLIPALDVLVVEDNEINRMVVTDMLTARGCRVTEACDGDEGVTAAAARVFDLILMDISMPRMDGVTATARIRAGGPNAATPIVALTAHALPQDRAQFLGAGMTATLTKPLSFAALDDLLASLDCTDEAVSVPTPADRIAAAHDHLSLSIGPERAAQVLTRILAETRDGADHLARMVSDRTSTAQVAALAHRLAGLVALIGTEDLRTHLLQIEAAARAVDDPSDPALVDLIKGLAGLIPEIA